MLRRLVSLRMLWCALACVVLAMAILGPASASAAASSRGVLSVTGSDDEGFQVQVDGRELPRNLASARNYFGRPAAGRDVGYHRDPDCQLLWRSRQVTATFFHGYGGVLSSCAPAAGTLVVEFGRGWTTDTGLQVGASLAELRAIYPDAIRHGRQAYPAKPRHGSVWGLVESRPPWGTIDVLAAHVIRGRVVALFAAGREAWDE